MAQAKSGDKVSIHYTGTFSDGTVFDSSEGREPLEFVLGSGQVIQGLDAHLDGMEVGAKSSVTIPADQAYGAHAPEAIQKVPLSNFPEDMKLEVGMQLGATSQDGQQLSFIVKELSDTEATLDGNHPLAGRDLTFAVELVSVG
jgi:peptidylprolyl isomerase